MLRIFSRFSIFSNRGLCSNSTLIKDEYSSYHKLIELVMSHLKISKNEAVIFIQTNNLSRNKKSFKQIECTLEYLTKHFTCSKIMSLPKCLQIPKTSYENRQQVFDECLFHDKQLLHFIQFISLMNKNIMLLKAYNLIHKESDVISNLKMQLDMPIDFDKNLTEEMPLRELRLEMMDCYIKERLKMSRSEIEKARQRYKMLNHQSLKSLVDIIDMLMNELNFTRERIANNTYLLYARVDNVRAIMNIKHIGGVDIKEIFLRNPKILIQTFENLTENINHIKNFNIPEEAILKCIKILTLSPDTVCNRLKELNEIEEFRVMKSNDRILRLILSQTKAKARLEYMKEMKMRCFSLSVLSDSENIFEKHVFLGADKTKGKEVIEFLSIVLNSTRKNIRAALKLHPHWIKVPLLLIRQTFEYLEQNGFSIKDMLDNIHILLYPVSRIKLQLDVLLAYKDSYEPECIIYGVDLRSLSKSKLLSLCLYFIEAEYHFTGMAVYEETKIDLNNEPETQLTLKIT